MYSKYIHKKENSYKETVTSVKGSNLPIVNILALLSTTTLKLSYQYLGGQISKLPNVKKKIFVSLLNYRQEILDIRTIGGIFVIKQTIPMSLVNWSDTW